MKSLTPYLAVAIVSLILGGMIFKSCFSKETDLQTSLNNIKVELQKEQDNRNQLENENKRMKASYDSLEAVKQKEIIRTAEREREIDENIAGDSTRARIEFNQALTENGEIPDPLPDNLNYVSYRDLGLSAKLMMKLPRVGMQLNICEQQVDTLLEAYENHQFIKKSYESSLGIHKRETKKLEIELERRNSFWYDRFAIVVGGGAGYDGTAVRPHVGVTVGVKVWGSE